MLSSGIGKVGVWGSMRLPQGNLQIPCCSRTRALHLLFSRSCLKVIQMCNIVADLYKLKFLILC